MDKIKAFAKDHKIISGLIAFTLFAIVLSPFTAQPESTTTDVNQEAVTVQQETELLEYEIVSEEDLSYSGCSRVAYRVILDGNQDQDKIDITLDSVIDSKKENWNDLTVWAYDFSERNEAIASSYTEGIAEYSTCM